TTNKNYLMAIIAGQDVKPNHNMLASKFGCSASASRQQWAKLKNEALASGFSMEPVETNTKANTSEDANNDGNGNTKPAAKPKAAPRKRAPKKAKETADAAKSGSEPAAQAGANALGHDNSEGEIVPPAPKKRKTAPRKTKAEKALESAMSAPKSAANVDEVADAPADAAENEEIKSMHTGATGEVATAISNEDM
ncbi:MAG: hypothetical protein Q9181_005956, partial [Wetmoreana brouardii]